MISLLAMSLGLRFRTSRKGGSGGGGRVHLKGAKSIDSRLGCRKTWVGCSFLLHMTGLKRTVFWPCGASISDNEAFISVCMGHWLTAVSIENSLMNGCGLSHESAEDDCKGSWVLSIKTLGNWLNYITL